MRQKTGAVLCSRCGKLVHVSEKRCPHCGAVAPSLFGFAPLVRKVLGPNSDLVTLIMLACGGLYVASLVLSLPFGGVDWGFDPFSFGSPSYSALLLMGMTGWDGWMSADGWWTPLTATFLHGSFLHLCFNMMWARALGGETIETFGPARFFVLWCATGIGGFLLSSAGNAVLWGSGPGAVGASGALFGMLGALAAFGHRRGGDFGRSLSRKMLTWALLGGAFGFIMPHVDNLAHGGGFITGLILGYVMPLQARSKEGRATQSLAALLAVGLVLGVAASVYTWLDVVLRWRGL